MQRGEAKQGPEPGFVDGAFELLLQLPHVADARVVVGRRLPVLGFAAGSRLLGLHHLIKKINIIGLLFSPDRRFSLSPRLFEKDLVVSRLRFFFSPSVLHG